MSTVHFTLREFLETHSDQILGALTTSVAPTVGDTRSAQIESWQQEITILKRTSRELIAENPQFGQWHLALEYELPRRQKRPDAVLLAHDVIFVIEFKVGATNYDATGRWQLENYCLNLRDFHECSAGRNIVPILCATRAEAAANNAANHLRVAAVQRANELEISRVISRAYQDAHIGSAPPLDPIKWIHSPYRPTLSILEAAQHLYRGQSVREISHSYANKLGDTTDMLARVIEDARARRARVVCFVTGVPGAGKTLVGLNVVHEQKASPEERAAGIFLSGNGPLVEVVRKSLILSKKNSGQQRRESEHEVSTFIQNVHQFLRHHRERPHEKPHEHVIVFDEAQRAWNQEQMMRKQKVESSEAAELFGVMDRLDDWAVIIALVGGGQEIFLGEAGLEEWGRAVATRPHWESLASPEVVSGGASVAGHRLFEDAKIPPGAIVREERLAHLSVGMRSFRAQQMAECVNAVLAGDLPTAKRLIPGAVEFPFFITRDLGIAKAWLRLRSESEGHRCGLVATSNDQRLRAYGLERMSSFRLNFPFTDWFLGPPTDIRSSFALEVAASEFECQGLELDWVGLCWGGDLRPLESLGGWEYRKFMGSKWVQVRQDVEKAFVRNRYRVLLTRARQGMVIWVPPGQQDDPTLDVGGFDRVYNYLIAAGVPELPRLDTASHSVGSIVPFRLV